MDAQQAEASALSGVPTLPGRDEGDKAQKLAAAATLRKKSRKVQQKTPGGSAKPVAAGEQQPTDTAAAAKRRAKHKKGRSGKAAGVSSKPGLVADGEGDPVAALHAQIAAEERALREMQQRKLQRDALATELATARAALGQSALDSLDAACTSTEELGDRLAAAAADDGGNTVDVAVAPRSASSHQGDAHDAADSPPTNAHAGAVMPTQPPQPSAAQPAAGGSPSARGRQLTGAMDALRGLLEAAGSGGDASLASPSAAPVPGSGKKAAGQVARPPRDRSRVDPEALQPTRTAAPADASGDNGPAGITSNADAVPATDGAGDAEEPHWLEDFDGPHDGDGSGGTAVPVPRDTLAPPPPIPTAGDAADDDGDDDPRRVVDEAAQAIALMGNVLDLMRAQAQAVSRALEEVEAAAAGPPPQATSASELASPATQGQGDEVCPPAARDGVGARAEEEEEDYAEDSFLTDTDGDGDDDRC